MAEFASSTKKKSMRGKERLLVQSVDLSNYVQVSSRGGKQQLYHDHQVFMAVFHYFDRANKLAL